MIATDSVPHASTYPAQVRAGPLEQGLVATADLPAGVVVAQFEGLVMRWSEVTPEQVRYAVRARGDRWLVPTTSARYANHSCDASCVVDEALAVVTARPVRRGDELTIDYVTVHLDDYRANPEHFIWDERRSFDCRCGAARCLGRIDGYRVVGKASDWHPTQGRVRVDGAGEKGRGVFARTSIKKGELIERAPVLVIPAEQESHLERTAVNDFSFCWGPNEEHSAIVFGLGSLMNHSYRPNARFIRNLSQATVDFVALRDLEPGEEITVNYNEDPNDPSPLWFEPVL